MTQSKINEVRNMFLLGSGKIKVSGWYDEKLLKYLNVLENWIGKYPNVSLLQNNLLKDYKIYVSIKDDILYCNDYSLTNNWEEEVRQEKEAHYKEVFGA